MKLDLNLPGATEVVTLVVAPSVSCVPVVDAVVLEFNAVPSVNGETVAVVVVEPKERFNGAFGVALFPREKPK